jgi:hypothetical protein
LGLGKRIRNPSSNHDNYIDNDDDHYDSCAYNNDHRCADDDYNEHDHNHYDDYDYDYDHNHNHDDYNGSLCLTSLYSCRGCIFLELGSRHEPFGNRR